MTRNSIVSVFLLLALLLGLVTPVLGQQVVTQPIRRFGLGTFKSTAYSPDGKHIVTCGGAGAFLWDVETGEVVREFIGHTSPVNSVVFSSDGTRVLTGSSDGTVRLWDVSTGAGRSGDHRRTRQGSEQW